MYIYIYIRALCSINVAMLNLRIKFPCNDLTFYNDSFYDIFRFICKMHSMKSSITTRSVKILQIVTMNNCR